MMEKYLNKTVKIIVFIGNEYLFYTGIVTEVNQTHISFLDRWGDLYTFGKNKIVEIACN